MKTLDKMNNVEKGRLLADLLPQHLPDLILFIDHQSAYFTENKVMIKNQWTADLVTADFWITLVAQMQKAVKKYGNSLCKNHRLFSDQLFDGYNALFAIYCLVEFTDREDCSPKLKSAVHLLFGSARLLLTTAQNGKR